jgi:prefoldin subunit 5
MANEADPVLIHRVETLERRTDRHGEMLDNLTNAVGQINAKHERLQTTLDDVQRIMRENQTTLIKWLVGIVSASFTGTMLIGGI